MKMKSTDPIKLSFVIPIYNVEGYLRECVQSILTQITGECEILLVDDGSTDDSGRICDDFAERDPRVRAIHKENGGVSSARNLGMREAAGRYIAFVDGDDRVTRGSVAPVLRWISEGGADICFLDGCGFYGDGRREPLGDGILPEKVKGKRNKDVLAHLAVCPKYPGSACTKVFRRGFLNENDLRFPEDRKHGEDLCFCRDCFFTARSFDVLAVPFYEYRRNREGSASGCFTWEAFLDISRFVTETAGSLTVSGMIRNEVAEYGMAFAAYEYAVLLGRCSRLPRTSKEKGRVFLKKYRWVLDYARSPRIRMVRRMTRLCGIRLSVWLLGVFLDLRR